MWTMWGLFLIYGALAAFLFYLIGRKHEREQWRDRTIDELALGAARYKCCDHCVDPTTGEYTSEHYQYGVLNTDFHLAPCNELSLDGIGLCQPWRMQNVPLDDSRIHKQT